MPLYGKDAYDDEQFALASFAVQGFFWWLCWWQWREGSIPADMDLILAKLPRAKFREAKSLWKKLLNFFPTFGDGTRRRNETLHAHRIDMLQVTDRKGVGAELTNAKRRGVRTGERDAQRDANRDAQHDATRDSSGVGSLFLDEETTGEGSGEGRQLTPQQLDVKRVLDALEQHTTGFLLPTGGLIVRWIRDFGIEATLATIAEEGARGNLDGRDPSYLFKCIESRGRRSHGRTGNANAGTDGRAAAREAGSGAG